MFIISYGGYAWVKEVEMVESVDDLKSSRSIKGTHGPDFELLDARIASALNNYATYLQLLFEMMIFRNSIRKGDGILLSMTKISFDDILEGL